jgi:hypothetical protein
MRNLLGLIILIFAGLITSCSTDFDVNADWEDETVVFGLLDQDNDVHYIRITKTFIGDEDAYVMAQVSDSLYYDSLVVTINEIGGAGRTFALEKVYNDVLKPEGVFANDPNILYKFEASLNPQAEYELNIFNPVLNKTISAKTGMVGNLSIKGSFEYPQRKINLSGTDVIELIPAANAKLYDILIRFHYYETYDEKVFVHDSIDYHLSSYVSETMDVTDIIEVELNGQAFLNFIGANLEEESGLKRVARSMLYEGQDPYATQPMDYDHGAIDIFITMGGEDLYTYIEVNKPSNGIVQEKPAFSNISNGIGLFSCRNTYEIYGKELSNSTLDSLAESTQTKYLNFRDQYGNYWWDSK